MEKGEATIRPVKSSDAEDVCRICCEDLGYQCEKNLVKERINRLALSREAVFVAEVDDKVVGYVHVERYTTLYYEEMANILGLAVSSKCRKLGLGRLLIEEAEKWANENEISLMRLNSGSARVDAHGFYQHLGYKSDKLQLRFIKRIDDNEHE